MKLLCHQRPDCKPVEAHLPTVTVGIEGNTLYLDKPSRLSHWVDGKAIVSTIHSMIEAREASCIGIKDIRFCGNKDENAYMDGNYGACLFFRNS